MDSPLPSSLARRWGNLRFIHQAGAHEWHSECPVCHDLGHGGNGLPDRFFMRDDGKPRGFCRKCGFTDFADSDKKDFTITPEMRAEWLKERQEREHAELAKAQRALELLKREEMWVKWHDGMTSSQRSIWLAKGVPEWAIDYYELGYCPNKSVWSDGQEFVTPTMTIPVFAPGRALVNIRHRLLNPPHSEDRYRPDRAGIPASLYLADPDNAPSGECILLEGEIKTIVVSCSLDNPKLCIVGIPGKTPRQDLLDKLEHCDRIHVMLDPDATVQAMDIARRLGKKRARVVTLPTKPDDAFVMFGATPSDFYAAMRYGRLVQ